MKYSIKKHLISMTKIVLFLTCALLIAGGTGHARGVKGEWKLPSHYPDGFDGYGCLMRMDAATVVIDDSKKKLAREWTYHTPDGNNMPVDYIRKNTVVGYMFDENNRIVSIWLVLETCETR